MRKNPERTETGATNTVLARRHVKRRVAGLSVLLLLFLGGPSFWARAEEGQERRRWGILTGYGTTHPGLGATSQKVRTVDLVVRYRSTLKETGQGWYRGSHDLIVELPVSLLVEPDGRPPILGLNFLACWTLRSSEAVRPYIFVGGGPVYTEADIAEMSTRWNGNHQAGCGVRLFPKRCWAWVLEYRFHHISNGGRKEPNDPLNSSKGLIGMEYRF